MKIRHLALLGALVPLAAFIGGCGGGNGNGVPTPTPIPAPTFIGPSTGSPNAPTIVVPQTVLRLPNGELGLLDLSRTGSSLTGQLRVFNAIASGNTLGAGLYTVNGPFSAPTAFSVSNNGMGAGGSPNAPQFTLTGNLPVEGSFANGGYTFTQDKFVATGDLLSSRQIFLPGATPYRPIGNLQFAQATDNGTAPLPAAVTPTGFNAFDVTAAPGDGGQRASFNYDLRDNPVVADLRVQAQRRGGFSVVSDFSIDIDIRPTAPFVVGQSFALGNSIQFGSEFAAVSISNNGLGYGGRSGTATIRSISGNTVAIDLTNIVLTPNANNLVPGNLTMNGSVEVSGIGAFVLGR